MKYEDVISEFLKDFPEHFSMHKEHINLTENELPYVFMEKLYTKMYHN